MANVFAKVLKGQTIRMPVKQPGGAKSESGQGSWAARVQKNQYAISTCDLYKFLLHGATS